MEYYRLEKDERIHNPINLNNDKLEKMNDLEDIVVEEELGKAKKIVDYIYKKHLFNIRNIVSDMVKEVFDSYQEDIKSRAIFITDQKAGQQYTYWELKLDPISCDLKKNKQNQDIILLPKSEIEQFCIFMISYNKLNKIIVRFDVAESIMRRFPLGIKFVPALFLEENR